MCSTTGLAFPFDLAALDRGSAAKKRGVVMFGGDALMRGGVVLLSAVVAGSLALVGCGGADESVMPSPDSAASADQADGAGSSPATSAADQSAVAVARPDKSTCWPVPPEDVVDQDYWLDDSEPVPCTEPHTTQTAYVFPLEEPTIADGGDDGRCLLEQGPPVPRRQP